MLGENDVVIVSRNGIVILLDILNIIFVFGVSILLVLRFFEVFCIF